MASQKNMSQTMYKLSSQNKDGKTLWDVTMGPTIIQNIQIRN